MKVSAISIVARLRRVASEAAEAGLVLIADGDGYIAILTAEEAKREDLRGLGVRVKLHGGCNAPTGDRTGGGKWM